MSTVMGDTPNAWVALWSAFDSCKASLARSKAVNVNSAILRDAAKDLVQSYFRHVRPDLERLNIDVASLDRPFQRLLQLANGRNAKTSYQRVLRELHRSRASVEIERERLLGSALHPSTRGGSLVSGVEQQITDTLERLVPSAALSYRQAIVDLADADRYSYRGPATDLRESLREALDHLAPDKEIAQSPGFKLEKDRTGATMKQKVRFILRSRGVGRTAMESPEAAAQRIEDSAGALARSVYTRGSISSHVATQREEVLQLKLYVDGILAELLQIHAQGRE